MKGVQSDMKWAVLCICVLFGLCGTAYAKVELEEGENQLQNGDFEQAKTPVGWVTEDRAPDATGMIELEKKEVHSGDFSLKVTAAAVDGTDWHFKVKQDRLSFEGEEKHTIKFWAKAEAPRIVQVCLQMNHDPWDGWLWQDVNLTTDWQEFVVEVTPPIDNDQEHWLAFHCGQSLDVWWLDDVRYYRGGPNDEKVEEERPRIAVDPVGKASIAWGELKGGY